MWDGGRIFPRRHRAVSGCPAGAYISCLFPERKLGVMSRGITPTRSSAGYENCVKKQGFTGRTLSWVIYCENSQEMLWLFLVCLHTKNNGEKAPNWPNLVLSTILSILSIFILHFTYWSEHQAESENSFIGNRTWGPSDSFVKCSRGDFKEWGQFIPNWNIFLKKGGIYISVKKNNLTNIFRK